MRPSLLRLAPLWVTLLGCSLSPGAVPPPDTAPDPARDPAPGPTETDWAALAAPRLPSLVPCRPNDAPESVLCGTIEVWEDRTAAAGRRLALDVIVVPAQTDDPPDDPVFVFEGGPGGAATKRLFASIYAGPVRRRDIVLVDQRGTGGSHRLECAWRRDAEPGQLAEMYPAAEVERCAAELAERADLRLYTTTHFVDDIEQVRSELGYGPINIRGGSYGTQSMMAFAQRHPASTRSLFGIATVSPLRPNLAERGVWTDRTIDRLSARCAADASCRALSRDLRADLGEILSRLEAAPREVTITDPADPSATLTVPVRRDWLTEQLRLLLYFATSSQALPWAAHSVLADDDWRPLVTLAVVIERTFRSSLAAGVTLTVQCSEGMHFDPRAALERGAATLVGTYRLEQQLQGCAHWPHRRQPPLAVAEPAVLDVPALFVSGALDPITPPEYAEDAATLFPNSLHVVLDDGQHGPFELADSWVCIHRLWADFLDRGSPQGVDVGCTRELRRPPFVVDQAAFDRYLDEQLLPFLG